MYKYTIADKDMAKSDKKGPVIRKRGSKVIRNIGILSKISIIKLFSIKDNYKNKI